MCVARVAKKPGPKPGSKWRKTNKKKRTGDVVTLSNLLPFPATPSSAGNSSPPKHNLLVQTSGKHRAAGFKRAIQNVDGARSAKKQKIYQHSKKRDQGPRAGTSVHQNGNNTSMQTSSSGNELGAFFASALSCSTSLQDQYFWDASVDGPITTVLMRLDKTHWGLKCTLFAMLSAAVHKQSFTLLGKICSLTAKLGIVFMQEIAPAYDVHLLTSMVTSTLRIDSNFDAFHPQVLAAHDAAVGHKPRHEHEEIYASGGIRAASNLTGAHFPPRSAMLESLGNRFIYAVKGQLTTRSVHAFSPAFKHAYESSANYTNYGTSIALLKKIFLSSSFHRVVNGMCYIIHQYKLPSSGPVSVSIPNLSVVGYPSNGYSTTIMTLYITSYQGKIGHSQTIYELVPECQTSTVEEDDIGNGVYLPLHSLSRRHTTEDEN